MEPYGISDETWFWGNVRKKEDGCWIWTGPRNKTGYGIAYYREMYGLAHRVSYVMHKGEIGPTLIVCHSCDVRSCVNPDHLWLGTYQDNTADMIAKGRAAWQKGEAPQGGEVPPVRTMVASTAIQRGMVAVITVLAERGALSVTAILEATVTPICARRTVESAMQLLRQNGIVILDHKEGNAHIYRLSPSLSAEAATQTAKLIAARSSKAAGKSFPQTSIPH